MKTLLAFSALAVSIAALGLTGGAWAQEPERPDPYEYVAKDPAGLFFEGDMVRGRSQDGTTGPTCVLTSEYKRLEHVVWRIRVLDAETRLPAGDKELKSVHVVLPGGERFEARFGTHPRREATDAFWATSWGIPADYPTGSIGYKVVAVDMNDQVHEWQPFNVAASQLKVIPGEVEFTKN